ncbi:metallophosphoesterase [Membranihabitans maritimus]|uniref:metallophosphoesterase n=1 Tax=Membranihabitans maritimus TaxID=2904244 RepID=UPI001F409294|nr:metallophosphoesterase [Membranihabitans maritimus]
MQRRKFIWGLGGALGIGALTCLYSWQIEPYWLEFVKLKMDVKNLPSELSGTTLMQVSDIHVGNRFDWNYIIQSFERAKSFNSDFVVYTGDYVYHESEEQFSQLSTVLDHAVKGRIGTVAILGNHDYGKN